MLNLPKQWLATGVSAFAKYVAQISYFKDQELLYRQEQTTSAEFSPNPEESERVCGFRVAVGKILYARADAPQSCARIKAGNTEVKSPKGFDIFAFNKNVEGTEEENSAFALFVFRNEDAKETIVGVLGSERGPVLVTNQNASEEDIELKPGEYAFISDDGRLIKGEFSLEHFYENNPLAFGLGRDSSYVDGLSGGKKRLFEKIRKATLEALENQDKPGPFELKTSNSPGIPGFKTIIDIYRERSIKSKFTLLYHHLI